MPLWRSRSARGFLADCALSRKPSLALAGRPIAAQYGVYFALARLEFDDGAAPRKPVRVLMTVQRWGALALAAALLGVIAAQAAELPSQHGRENKPKQANAARVCNVAGSPGVLAANGVCVRFSGYVSSRFGGAQLK